jgi:hypothetical protein
MVLTTLKEMSSSSSDEQASVVYIHYTSTDDDTPRTARILHREGPILTIQEVGTDDIKSGHASHLKILDSKRVKHSDKEDEEEEDEDTPKCPSLDQIKQSGIPTDQYEYVMKKEEAYKRIAYEVLKEKTDGQIKAKFTLTIYQEAMFRFLGLEMNKGKIQQYYTMETGCREWVANRAARAQKTREQGREWREEQYDLSSGMTYGQWMQAVNERRYFWK